MNKKVLYLLLILVLVCSVVFAACDDETVTITYNYNYQGAPEDKVVTLEIDAEITLETPTRSGYTFDGWFIDASCVTSFAQTVASQSVTLYAKWTEIHTHSLRYEHTDSKHWQECDCGHTTAQQDHQFDENNACVCGYVQSAVHTHSWATEWSNDDTNHWKVCSGCAELNEKATHDTNGVDGACSVCGYKTAVVVEPVVLYFYNANDWEQVYAYSWLPEALGTYPGTQLSAIAEGSKWYSVQMDATVGGFQFNNGKSGTEEKKTGDLTIQEGKPYFYSGTWYATQAEADEAIAQPPVTTYVLKGSFNNWGSGEPVVFEPHSETEVKLLGFELAAGAEFKVVISVTGQEDEWIGTLKDGVTVATYSADGNITVANAGKYDLYFDIQAKQLWIVATHEHSWATEFSSDATHHWYACDCAEVKDKAEHVPGAAATETTPQICTVCQRVLVPELGHVHVGVEHTANPATCVDQGNSAYWSCACGKYFSDSDCQNEIAENSWVIPATGEHNYVDGTCDCGAKAPVTVYFYIADMASVNAYTWTSAGNPLSTWPGVAMTPVADDEGWFSIEIAGIADNIIFNWNDGRGQTADLVVANGPYFYNNQGFATKEAAEEAIAQPVVTTYLLKGSFNDWGAGDPVVFEPHSETEVKLLGFELAAGAEFKVVISSTGSLDEWVGTLKDGVTDATYSAGGNITVANAGKYDLYFDIQAKQLWIVATHEHSWATEFSSDATHHWYACDCAEVKDKAEHVPGAAATETTPQICTVCQRVLVAELGHTHVGVEHTANQATCTTAGNSAYWSCACGKYFSDADCQNEIAENSWVIPATGEHNYVDGTCDCGAKAHVTVYFYIADMASVNAYTWTSAGNPLSTWPGVAMTPVADDEGWFSIEIAGIADNIIFNWNDGRGQTADLVVADGPYFYNNQGFATKEAAEQAIALPVETMYLLRGTFNGWGDGAIIIFEPHSETEVKLIGFELEAGAEFKVVISSTGSLDEWVGTLKDGVTDATYSEGGNITVANAGKYDLYFDIQAKQLWISAHGHSYGEWANGTDDDANNHIRSCVCGEIESHPANYANWALATEGDNQGKHVGTCSCGLVLAHEPSANADDNDCTTAIVCSVCNLEMTPAKSHDYDNDCDTNCNNAGCTAGDRTTSHQVGGWTYSDDFTQRWHQCSVCGNKADLQAHAHASDTLLFRNDYQEQYKVCADCNQEFDVATHTHSGGSASCGNQAVCSVCMQKYGEFVDHVPQEIEGKAPTCTETGLTVGSKCSSCEQIITEQQTIDALGHTWEDPNCTIPRTCSVCNLTEGQAAGHSYQSVVTPPTCTEGGYTTHTCSVCDDTYTDAQTVAAGHSWVDATCTAPKTCSVCDLTEGTALGHDYAEVVTAPTCTEGGYTTYTCGTCNDSYVDDEVDAAGHDYEAVVTPPTCTAEGFTTHTCSKCDDSYVDSTVGMVAHDYVNFVCSVCGVNNYVVKGIAGDWSVGVPLVANPGNQNEVMLLAVELAENATFKIYINDNSIEENERWIGALKDGVTVATYSASGNIFVAAAGKYDLYFDLGVKQLWIAAHSHVSTGTYASDENGHWVVCACGENVLQGEHSGADDGDCTTAINCSVCNYELTAGNANHSLSADWSSDATNHWHACTNADCLATGEVNAHVAGPEATETTPQICTVCQKILAPVTTHTHVGVEHAAIAATCTTAGNSAYWSCACGKYFSDADCQNEIAENSWVIAATGEHNYVDGACVCGSRVIYFVPNSDWNQAGARFAAYFFEGSDTVWVDLTDEDGDGTYQVVVPEGYTNVIICRMNPSTTENNWDNRWNQTGDLTVPTDSAVLYTVPNGTWDGSDNTHWSTL